MKKKVKFIAPDIQTIYKMTKRRKTSDVREMKSGKTAMLHEEGMSEGGQSQLHAPKLK